MSEIKKMHKQRSKLNSIYNAIIKIQNLPNDDFDFIMKLWVDKNKKLEAKEHLIETIYIKPHTFYNNKNT